MAEPEIKTLKKKMTNGTPVFGPWCVIPSRETVSIISTSGFDFVIIDMEHGPASFETAEAMVLAAQAEGVGAIVRLGQIDEENILKALDIGADGVLVAHVSNEKDAQLVADCALYHPKGKRGFSPYTRAGDFSGGNIAEHAKKQNERVIVGVLVEGLEGIQNLQKIVSVKNLDLVYIGAYDLSQALGMPGEVGHPDVKKAMENAVKVIRSSGLVAGGYVAKDMADINWMLGLQMQFITYLPDCALFHRACSSAVSEYRLALEGGIKK